MPIFHYKMGEPVQGVYKKSVLLMPSGAVFHAPLESDASSAVTGQALIARNVTYETVDGIPCAYFDGNATIYMPDDDENILRLPTGNMPGTISLWFKSTAAQYASIMNYCGENRTSRGIWLNTNGNITLDDGFGNLSDTVGFKDDTNHFNGNWCHALITYNGTTLKLYIDGIEKSSVDYELNTGAMRFGIGAWAWGHVTHYFTGYVASVRVYDRVVTAEELLTLSKEFIPSLLYPTSTGFDEMGGAVPYYAASLAGCALQQWVDENTVLYLPMYGDEPFVDKSVNAYAFNNNGVTFVSDVKPTSGGSGAAHFTAANQYLLSSSNMLAGLTEFTLEFDYMLDSIPTGNDWSTGFYFAGNGPNQSSAGTDMRLEKNYITVQMNYETREVKSAYTPDTGVWHTLRISRNADSVVSISIDNELINSYTDTDALYSSQSYGFVIGRAEPYGEVGTGFRGYIANYRISNIVRG